VPFLRVKSDRKATTLPHALFPPNTSDKNFEVAILLKIVQRSFNENSGVETTPPGASVVSYGQGVAIVCLEGMLV